jgi:polar amino acid transport system ATP-binding protein
VHLDEVTSALDPGLVAEVLNVIWELAEMGITMIIASHEMSFVRDTAHRVCFLDSGVILEEGLPETMFRVPDYPRTKEFLQRIIEAGRAVDLVQVCSVRKPTTASTNSSPSSSGRSL